MLPVHLFIHVSGRMHHISIFRREKNCEKLKAQKQAPNTGKKTKDRVVYGIHSKTENILLFASLRQYSELNNSRMEKNINKFLPEINTINLCCRTQR